MTNEEAIATLKDIYENALDYNDNRTNEAFTMAIAALGLSLRDKTSDKWISVKEYGNPEAYTEAWVYTEDGRVEEDTFHPSDVGKEYSSNIWEGKRTSDGWYQNGTNLQGESVIYWMPFDTPNPPQTPMYE